MPETTYDITDEMVTFTQQSQGATAAILEGLNTQRVQTLVTTLGAVVSHIQSTTGATITQDEAVSLPGVKAVILGGGNLDLDTIEYAAQRYLPRVAHKIATKQATAASNSPRNADGSPNFPMGWDDMPAQTRMNWARQHGFA